MTSIYGALQSRGTRILFGVLCASLAGEAIAVQAARAGGPPPAVQVSFSSHAELHDGQTVSVAVSANSYFNPYAEINIVECADPGGLESNLPIDSTTCDGNTAQGPSILVGKDGSFALPVYTVYALPNLSIGDSADSKPVCDQTHYCVLYVGQNTNDFTAPKAFSVPFLITPGAGTPAPTTTGGAAAASGSSAATGSSPAVALAPSASSSASATSSGPAQSHSSAGVHGDLANTGATEILWVAASGLALLLTGGLGRRLILRRVR